MSYYVPATRWCHIHLLGALLHSTFITDAPRKENLNVKKNIMIAILRKQGVLFERTNKFFFLKNNNHPGACIALRFTVPWEPAEERRVREPGAGSGNNPDLGCFRWSHVMLIFPERVAWVDVQLYKSHLGAWPVSGWRWLMGACRAPRLQFPLYPTIKASCPETESPAPGHRLFRRADVQEKHQKMLRCCLGGGNACFAFCINEFLMWNKQRINSCSKVAFPISDN